jgi:hypothetical protein
VEFSLATPKDGTEVDRVVHFQPSMVRTLCVGNRRLPGRAAARGATTAPIYLADKEAAVVDPRKTPQDLLVPLASYPANLRPGVVIKDANGTKGQYPMLLIASGKKPAAKAPDGKVVHVPYTDLLNADGTPKAA